jgi:hypothetical protein
VMSRRSRILTSMKTRSETIWQLIHSDPDFVEWCPDPGIGAAIRQ